jgi:phosphoribosylanthranilate isomerase
MTFIKICGLRTVEQALVAAEAGADMLGFILAQSRRQVSPAEIATMAAAVRAATKANQRPVELVGVFVDETLARMLMIADQCGLDALQLSGDEASAVLADLPDRNIIKAVRLNGTTTELGWMHGELSSHIRLLVDAHVPGFYGGAGVLADWQRAADLARDYPVLLAGGLTPDNVAAAIRQVRPWGVDVSSGVESGGVKDLAKIRAFISAARAADQQIAYTSAG